MQGGEGDSVELRPENFEGKQMFSKLILVAAALMAFTAPCFAATKHKGKRASRRPKGAGFYSWTRVIREMLIISGLATGAFMKISLPIPLRAGTNRRWKIPI